MMQNIPVQQSAPSLMAGICHNSGPLTMSTLEIAELTGKRHGDVIRDAKAMLGALAQIAEDEIDKLTSMDWMNRKDISRFLRHQGISIAYDNRGYISEINLPKRESLILVSGYRVDLRAKIIDRWMELEEATQKPASPTTYLDALKALVASEEAKQIAEHRALIAERTKAEIGTRREATAMNTASLAVKKASRLEQELDRSQAYATIKRMSMLYHGQKFDWRHLKRTSAEMGIPAVDVFDQNYGTVKAYHADVWREAYALDIPVRLDDEAA